MARLNMVRAARKATSCGRCGKTIAVGDPYFWWKNRAPGQRSGVKRVRCSEHRPRPSEMMPGRRGQLAAIQEELDDSLGSLTVSVEDGEAKTPDTADFEVIAEAAGEALREIAGEIQEGAENIEQGFGHATYQSEEMAEKAQELESICDDMANLSFEDPPEREDDESDEDWESRLESWLEEQGQQIRDKVDEAEV